MLGQRLWGLQLPPGDSSAPPVAPPRALTHTPPSQVAGASLVEDCVVKVPACLPLGGATRTPAQGTVVLALCLGGPEQTALEKFEDLEDLPS